MIKDSQQGMMFMDKNYEILSINKAMHTILEKIEKIKLTLQEIKNLPIFLYLRKYSTAYQSNVLFSSQPGEFQDEMIIYAIDKSDFIQIELQKTKIETDRHELADLHEQL